MRNGVRVAVVCAGLTLAAFSLPAPLSASAVRPRAVRADTGSSGGACAPWSVRTLATGQGWLENLAFDGRGAMTISALAQGRLLNLTPDGRLSVRVPSVSAPGGQKRRGHFLYFNTGDVTGPAPTGTIDRLDLRTGRRSTWARVLTMPNGLALLPDGDAIVTAEGGPLLTRIPADDPSHPQFGWAPLDDTNGIAVDPSGRWLYVDRTFSVDGEVDRLLVSDPRRVQVVGHLGARVLPDDMTVDRHGILYIAGFGSGDVYRLDPRTHVSCAIASGLTQPTSTRFGGRGWHRRDLYVTDAGGHVSELTKPKQH